MSNEAEILRLMNAAFFDGPLKLPKGIKTAQQIIEFARTARHEDGQRVVPVALTLTLPVINPADIENRWHDVPADMRHLPRRRKSRLIITVATGYDHEQLLAGITGPIMAAYARKVGADFIALTGVTQPWWGMEKFRIRPLAERYQRTMFIDADVLIRDGSPDIFDVVPEDHVGMHDDYPHCAAKNGLWWLEPSRRAMLDSQMVDYYGYPGALNSGVVVFSQEHVGIWSRWPSMDFPREHVDEQLWVEWLARRFPVTCIPTVFNTQWWFQDFFERAKWAWFVHAANCPSGRRAELFRRFMVDGNTREADRTQ